MVDVDHFKRFNDTYGHPAGDKALVAVVRGLCAVGRGSDVVGRYGGEEFMIILPHTDRRGALNLAQRMRQKVEDSCVPDRHVTVSVGAATLYVQDIGVFDPKATGEQLIEQADKALYESKAQGRNRVTHYDDIAGANA